MHYRQRNSYREYVSCVPVCNHYKKSLVGFCLHCGHLEHKHCVNRRQKEYKSIDIKPNTDTIERVENEWILL